MAPGLIQDTLRAAPIHGVDAARPEAISSPLPGGVAEVVRFIFNVPQWIQIVGFFLGLAVAGFVAVQLWRRRQGIAQWIRSRERGVQLGLAAGVFLFVLAAGGTGAVSWNYMQHDNGFCTGCHVMTQPFGQFQARAGKHDSLECHNCHQQSLYASARQLVLWVAERPEKIGAHAKVPTAICAQCHVNPPEQKEVWQRIAQTAGHRTHLESDSSALTKVECITCHGVEIHKFVPVDKTCMQSGCHEQTKITLGKMATQTSLHCVTCHQFTADVPRLATRDSAAGTLVPTNKQCLSCHEMQRFLVGFDPARDPHNGTCGMCHNPHQQQVAKDASTSCTAAGCHANWETEPFHRGVAHRKVAQSCLTCHAPHSAKVDASDCESCHAAVRQAGPPGRRRHPPLPFDTLRALRDTTPRPPSPGGPVSGFLGWGPPMPWSRPAAPILVADSFPHPRHQRLPCLTCHSSTTRHGRLTFEPPRGCQICHHQPSVRADCAACHQPAELAKAIPTAVTVRVPDRPVRRRSVGFAHPAHRALACLTCHPTPVTLAADSATRTCVSCHVDHHRSKTGCATCHTGADWKGAHAKPVTAHERCDACHASRTVGELTPSRGFCLTCHGKEDRHYPAQECAVCHFLTSPEALRPQLQRPRQPN